MSPWSCRPLPLPPSLSPTPARTLVTRILQKFRSTVETAENGAIGVEIFKKNKGDYSCVLMDINMPVMDGLQATVEMRKLMAAGECKRIPVLALSASCSDEEIARCRVAGMACHISKPMNLGFFQARAGFAPQRNWDEREKGG